MTPKISIIIPVYNVEQYLRQCLDSVVNQTLRDIQIICVNDGSTDGSLAILQEYADRDSRIEVIDRANGGNPGSARNAGIPHVRGKCIHFLDSDDWIAPALCEKAYYRLESTGADIVFFFAREFSETGQETRLAEEFQSHRWSAAPVQADELLLFNNSPWNRVIRTSFFQSVGVHYPEEFLQEDLYLHWVHLVNDPQVEMILEELYHYRIRKESLIGQMGTYAAKDPVACSLIKKYLLSIGKYEKYRDTLLLRKFRLFYCVFPGIQKSVQPDALKWFRESLDDEELDFLKNDDRLGAPRDFILPLLGEEPLIRKQIQQTIKSRWRTFNNRFLRRFFRPVEDIVRILNGKPPKRMPQHEQQHKPERTMNPFELRIHELSEQLAERDRIIVHLRNREETPEHHVT